MIRIEAPREEAFGSILRAALAFSTASGQSFELLQARGRALRSGLLAPHVDAVRAAALACRARTGGVFAGSPDVRFEPGPLQAARFRFEIEADTPVAPLLLALLPALATASAGSRVDVVGGTHLAGAATYHQIERPWGALMAQLGLRLRPSLLSAGFRPSAPGEVRVDVLPWDRAGRLDLEHRGELLALRGLSLQARLKVPVAQRQRDAAAEALWEARRLEAAWEVGEVEAGAPGSFLLLEAVFERGRAAFAMPGAREEAPEALGGRAARWLLRFLEAEEALDPWLAEQIVVPMALGQGGCFTTTEASPALLALLDTARSFGAEVLFEGRPGGPSRVQMGGLPPGLTPAEGAS